MEQEIEIWRPIKDFEGLYEVSTFGRVKSIRRDIMLKPGLTTKGYPFVGLHKNGKNKNARVHRLVFLTFWDLIPNCPNPYDNPHLEVNHKNGIKTDRKLDNLELMTHKQNIEHSYEVLGNKRHYGQLGENNLAAKLTKEDVFELHQWLTDGKDMLSFSKIKKVSFGCIYSVISGQSWKHLGLDWSKFYHPKKPKNLIKQ